MVVDQVGEPAGKTTQTDTSSNAQSRQVAGAAERIARARSPSPKTAYPSAFSQEGPCPGSPDRRPGPGRTLREAFSCRELRAPDGAPRQAWRGRLCPMGAVWARPGRLLLLCLLPEEF